ncbi:MAG: hypothetical protein IPL16_15620 [Ignavibacteria bacterium]|nr:hypothetical protein [Ignavibacteria bacterium]
MKSIIQKYYNSILQTPFFENNDFKANLILLLSMLFFIVAAEDLTSEMAKEKDEISFISATLTESVDFLNFNTIGLPVYSPELITFLQIQNTSFSKQISYDFNSGRSPPLS